jgi:hypothetical protein
VDHVPLDPGQAEKVDLVAFGFEMTQEMVEPELIAVVGRVGNERGQDEDVQ